MDKKKTLQTNPVIPAYAGRILVVDDEPNNVKLLEALLSPQNYEVIKAYDGKEALELLEKNPNIDLILLDVMMPDMDGYEVCAAIKNNQERKDIPVIFLTALTDDRSQVRAFKHGAADFISKPFKIELINARVKTHLDLKLNRDQMKFLLSENKRLIQTLEKVLKQVSIFWILLVGLLLLLVMVIFFI